MKSSRNIVTNLDKDSTTGVFGCNGDKIIRPSFTYSELVGIGYEQGVTRRDPSDVIMVNDLYYVWYTKITDDSELYPSGYAGTIWYAVSKDGSEWIEKGQAIGTGPGGSFDSFGVFTPNILAFGKRYYLYYTAVAEGFINEGYSFISKTSIAVAIFRFSRWSMGKIRPEPYNCSRSKSR